MAKLKKDELAKLMPAERIRKLKELEEEEKKEIEEAEELIKESEGEIEKDAMTSRVSVPESKQIDISKLFEPPPPTLEKVAEEARMEPSPEQIRYMVNQAYEEAAALGYQEPTPNVMERLDTLGEKLERINYKALTTELAERVVATRTILYKIKKHQGQVQRW